MQICEADDSRLVAEQSRYVPTSNYKSLDEDRSVTHSNSISPLISYFLEYTGKQAHSELAERMKQRDAGA